MALVVKQDGSNYVAYKLVEARKEDNTLVTVLEEGTKQKFTYDELLNRIKIYTDELNHCQKNIDELTSVLAQVENLRKS